MDPRPDDHASAQPRLAARPRSEFPVGPVLAGGLISALVFASALVVPGVLLIAPFPLTVLRLRAGMVGVCLAALTACALLGALLGPDTGLLYLLVVAGPGLVLGDTLARGRGLRRACVAAFAVTALELGVALLFAPSAMGNALTAGWNTWANEPGRLATLRDGGLLDQWEENTAEVGRLLGTIYPAAYLVFGGLLALANGLMLGSWLTQHDPGWLDGGEFEGIRWPLALPMLFVVSGLAILVPSLHATALNALLVEGFFFTVQGLAITVYWLRRLNLPPGLRLVLGGLGLVALWSAQGSFLGGSLGVLALLGLFDTWADFRSYADLPEEDD